MKLSTATLTERIDRALSQQRPNPTVLKRLITATATQIRQAHIVGWPALAASFERDQQRLRERLMKCGRAAA